MIENIEGGAKSLRISHRWAALDHRRSTGGDCRKAFHGVYSWRSVIAGPAEEYASFDDQRADVRGSRAERETNSHLASRCPTR